MTAPDPRSLVDPELFPLLEQWPTLALSDDVLPLLRQARAAARAPVDPSSGGVEVAVRTVPGPPGAPDVRVISYHPQSLAGEAVGANGCVLHIHGGGYILGDPDSQEPGHRELARRLGCRIVSVDYRLAPETRAPGAVEDCYAVLAWLVANAAELRLDPARIGVAGESAGGGLAAALALLARDRGEYRLAFQHLIYPMIDDRTCVTSSPNVHAGEFIWTPESNRYGWRSLLGFEPGGEGVSPYAAAARATDLSGLPPTYISVGALDLFVDENLEYARRLIRAGVPTELHVYPGAYHGFEMDPKPQISQTSARNSEAALARALAAPR